MTDDVAAVQNDVASMAADVERNSADITSLGVRGHWCAARTQNYWTRTGTITYDSITYSDSNMNITDTPLDINTGNAICVILHRKNRHFSVRI